MHVIDDALDTDANPRLAIVTNPVEAAVATSTPMNAAVLFLTSITPNFSLSSAGKISRARPTL